VFTTPANGRHIRDLTNGYGTFNTDPAWSPDGRRLVFVVSDHGGLLAVMNADGSHKASLASTTTGGDLESPSWSRDGTEIVYSSDFGGSQPNRGIFLVRPDGTGRHLIRTGGFDPQWSPSNTKIVYAVGSNPDESQGIAVMNADGSGSNVIAHQRGATDPQWSPDGRRIAYAVERAHRSGIYLVSMKGGSARLAVRSRGGAFDPSWRPATPLRNPPRQTCP
jgi:TolB protein